MLQAAPAPTLIAQASRHDDANAMLETQGRAPLAETREQAAAEDGIAARRPPDRGAEAAAARSGVSRSVPIKKSMAKDSTLEDSSRQRLAREELQGLSASQLLIARNEIFARRGRYFKDEALRDYFSQFSWYQPSAWDVALSPVEQANVELIQSVEQSSASRHASSPGRVRRCEGTVC
jgi:hypothetical protein